MHQSATVEYAFVKLGINQHWLQLKNMPKSKKKLPLRSGHHLPFGSGLPFFVSVANFQYLWNGMELMQVGDVWWTVDRLGDVWWTVDRLRQEFRVLSMP